jgi:hypothetical protein
VINHIKLDGIIVLVVLGKIHGFHHVIILMVVQVQEKILKHIQCYMEKLHIKLGIIGLKIIMEQMFLFVKVLMFLLLMVVRMFLHPLLMVVEKVEV